LPIDRYSKFDKNSALPLNGGLQKSDVLIIDSVGLLSKLYSYATITYVGGGFTKDGIHNILEAAVYGKPVIIGPNYKKYREAKELIEAGGAVSLSSPGELNVIIDNFLNDGSALSNVGAAAKEYVHANTGATRSIMNYIDEKRLLTN
jgi:3-deoxy-D-manno-octulosonic-acid transferase